MRRRGRWPVKLTCLARSESFVRSGVDPKVLVESHDRWTETGRRTDVAVVAGLVGGVAQHERKRLVDDL